MQNKASRAPLNGIPAVHGDDVQVTTGLISAEGN